MIIHATAGTAGSGGFTAAPAGGRPGFSLTELLIAIGVLGIGLGMIAALFVTGLTQVRMSLGASEGGMVASNGIAVAKMFLKPGKVVDNGTASGGTVSTLTNSTKLWVGDEFQDCHVEITGGAGNGQIRMITTNTNNMLTVSPMWNIPPGASSVYVITSGVPSGSLAVMADESNTTVINADFQKYPYADATTNKGFVILARQAGAGAYQIVSVAYAKTAGGTVTAQTVTTTAAYDNATEITFSAGDDAKLSVGSPVIVTTSQEDVLGPDTADAVAGDYAEIVSLSGAVVTLDHGLTIGSGATAYVIVETGASSPATGVCITKTGLKP